MKKLSLILVIISIGVGMISCGNSEKVSNKTETTKVEGAENSSEEAENKNTNKEKSKKEVENDNIFIGLRANGGSSGNEILVKKSNETELEAIDIGADPYSLTYSDKLNRLFFVDRYGTIRTHGENDTKEYGHNSTGSYRSAAAYKMFDLGVAYKMPKDKSSLIYTNTDRELFYTDSTGAQKKVSDGIGYMIEGDEFLQGGFVNERYFDISDNGKYIYSNSNQMEDVTEARYYSLARYEVEIEETINIQDGVTAFAISPNGENVVYYMDEEEKIYVRNDKKNTTRDYEAIYPWNFKVFDDGSAMFIEDVQEDILCGFATYIDDKGEAYKIPSKVRLYEIMSDDLYIQVDDRDIYFINDQSELCLFNIDNNEVKVLFKNVDDFEVLEKEIYLTTSEGKIYKLNKSGEEKLISDEKSEFYNFINIDRIGENDVLIKTQNGKLFINEENIDENVEGYSVYGGKVAYCTAEDEVFTVDIKTGKSKLEFTGYKDLEYLYYGNKMLSFKQIE